MQKVAVTGATGFIGRRVVRRLVDAGISVKALSRREDPELEQSGAMVVKGTMEDLDALTTLTKDVEAVVHAAGATRARSAKHFAAVNAEFTRHLVAVAARCERPPHFLLISSLAAREPGISPYAASKRAAERVLEEASPDLDWVVLRPPAVYGPADRATLVLFKCMKRGVFPVPGDGRGRLSLIHVNDLAGAIVALVAKSPPAKQIMEIRDGKSDGYSWPDLVRAAEYASGRAVRPLYLPAPIMRLTAAASETICRGIGLSPMITPGKVREILHRDWVCRDNPVAEQTDWRPTVGLESGFRTTFEWYAESGWI